MANVIGEPFKEYVNSQIKKRQEIHGKKNRTIQEISYLNSTNSWVKLASGVSLSQERLDLLKTSYGNPLVDNTIPGKDLAINNVLFNGLTSVGDSYTDNEGNEKTTYNLKISQILEFYNSKLIFLFLNFQLVHVGKGHQNHQRLAHLYLTN